MTTDCWIWEGALNPKGYGTVGKFCQLAHRVSYETFRKPIKEGYELHHECENKKCVNPNHLKMLTKSEHSSLSPATKTHCPNGHEYTGENVYMHPTRGRNCQECRRIAARRYYYNTARPRKVPPINLLYGYTVELGWKKVNPLILQGEQV